MVRDLGLTKSNAELLSSRLREWNLLDSSCRISIYRKSHLTFSSYYTFSAANSLCYCSNVYGLFNEISIDYNPSNWRLFIDSSTQSLKAVLLHNGNEFPSIPLAHSVQMKENYDNVKQMMEVLNYQTHRWDVCGDFKMIGFLLGLQGGYTKHSCFPCLWNSRADNEHYVIQDWPVREELIQGSHNVIHKALVQREKVLLHPLHIKLGVAK